MKNYPFFISHEYEKFEKLYEAGLYTGAAMELKDLFEVVLKLPVLTGMAYIAQNGEEEDVKDCIKILIRKPPALGDWKVMADVVAEKLPDRTGDVKPLLIILENVIELYNNSKANIIKWRNDLFGHGAYVDDQFYLKQVEEKRKYLDHYLEKTAEAYNCLKYYINGVPVEEMQGKVETMPFNDLTDMTISIAALDSKRAISFSVNPFICRMFFYDSLNIHSMRVYGLNYLSGEKASYSSDFLVDQYYEAVRSPREKSTLSSFQDQETETVLNELNAILDLVGTKGYTPMGNLSHWFESCLDEKKGVFLLQMERGMGKTGFVSHLDPLFGASDYQNLFMRCYYCSRMEYRSAMDFANTVYQLWFIREDGGLLQVKDADIHSLQNDTDRPADDLCQLLEDVYYYGDQEYGKEKVVLWIDGIDELKFEYMHHNYRPNSPLKKGLSHTLLDYIPKPDDLPENVYVFLTCRTINETYPEEIKRWITDSSFTGHLEITRSCPEHIENLRTYVKEKIGKRMALSSDQVDEIIRVSENNYLNIKTMLPSLIGGNNSLDMQSLTAESIVTNYLKLLGNICGTKQRRYLNRILAILAFAREPLSVEQISYLSEGRTNIRVELIVALKQLSGLISANHTLVGDRILFSVSNIAFKEVLKSRYSDFNRSLVNEWIDNMMAVKESAYEICKRSVDLDNYNYVFNEGSLYLYSNILDYAEEIGNMKVLTQPFADCLMQYENHLNGKIHGTYGVNCDIAISDEIIQILQELEIHGEYVNPETLSIAFNNKVYHIAFTLYDYENAIKLLREAIRYLEMVPVSQQGIRYSARCGRIYNNMADLLRATGRSFEEIRIYREKAGDYRRSLMKGDFVTYAEDYTMYLLGKADDALICSRWEELKKSREEAIEIYDTICHRYLDQCDNGMLNPRSGNRQEYGYEFHHIAMEILYARYLAKVMNDDQSAGEEAENILKRAVGALEQLMKRSKIFQPVIVLAAVRAAFELSEVYSGSGREKEAEKLLRENLVWVRTLYLKNPDYLNYPTEDYLEKLKGYLRETSTDEKLRKQIEKIMKKTKHKMR